MEITHICPKCGQQIESSRVYDKVVVCQSCGWIKSTKSSKRAAMQNFTSIFMSGLFIVLAVSAFMFYVRSWDTLALRALPLHLKHLTGVAKTPDTLKMIEICEQRKNLECVLKYSQRLLNIGEHRLHALRTMGHNLYIHKDYDLAMVSLSDYEAEGGDDLTVLYEYGKVLKRGSQYKESIRVFEKVLRKKPAKLQISVLQEYVKSLIKDGQFKKALQTIEYVQENATRSHKFMESEIEKLKFKVKASQRVPFTAPVKKSANSSKAIKKTPGRIYKLPAKRVRRGA